MTASFFRRFALVPLAVVACLAFNTPSVVAVAGATWQPASTAALESAFHRDNFTVTRWVTFNGSRGAEAHSLNATFLNTGAPKKAFYVEGSAYEMGYLTGVLGYAEAEAMVTKYLDGFIPALILGNVQRRLENDSAWEAFEARIGAVLVHIVNTSYHEQVGSDTWPETLLQEMRGVVDGARSVVAATNVTYERLVTINYGFDLVSARIFSGHLSGDVLAGLQAALAVAGGEAHDPLGARLVRSFSDATEGGRRAAFRPPASCDAFGAVRTATARGSGAIFARDFQLPTADVFQSINAIIIYNPSDGRNGVASATVPGMVGSITAMSAAGVGMGVDTLRSAAGNPAAPGFNSIMLVRHVADTANSTVAALDTIRDARRGCPWLYPLCDRSGDCRIVEALAHHNGTAADLDPLKYLDPNEDALRALLPNSSFVRANAPEALWLAGAFAHGPEYAYPSAYQAYNPALLQRAGMAYNASAFVPGGHLFANFTDEKAVQGQLLDNYFPPPRAVPGSKPDFVMVSNLALVPDVRLTMMSDWSDLLQGVGGSAIQWRYDTLHALVTAAHGTIDLAVAKELITFLAPDRTPGFWTDRLIPSNPMSAQIEGSLTVMDLETREMHVKAGYFTDAWIGVHLLAYL